jgi:hypothetical protein
VQVHYRDAVTPEGTYTWRCSNDGQFGVCCNLLGMCFSGAWQGVLSIGSGYDPSYFRKISQPAANPQTLPAIVIGHGDSVAIAGWVNGSNAQPYVSATAINGVTPTLLTDTNSAVAESDAVAMACWLAPGVGTWAASASLAAGTAVQWADWKVGIRATPPPPLYPPTPVLGMLSFAPWAVDPDDDP